MTILSDCLTYMRRFIKFASNSSISDALLIDYLNRFYIYDVDARIQLFDNKKKYQFETYPGRDRYNMPLYDTQIPNDGISISSYPLYQGFMSPVYVDGREIAFYTDKALFERQYDSVFQRFAAVGVGDGSRSQFTLQIPLIGANSTPINNPVNSLVRGHVDMTGIIASGANIDPPLQNNFLTTIPTTSVSSAVYFVTSNNSRDTLIVADSGQYLESNLDYGLMMSPGKAPFGNASLGTYSETSNTINYLTGQAIVSFPEVPPDGVNIDAQVKWLQTGRPSAVLFNNNTLTFRTVPDRQYIVEVDAFLTPAAFLNTSDAIPFAYMGEYLALGGTRKLLSDIGDTEQLAFYEPRFREQELLIIKRAERQFTSTPNHTIYTIGRNYGNWGQSRGTQ